MNSIQENINKIKQNIPNYVTIIAVSKFQPIEKIQSAYDAGHRDFGENYVQEMVNKYQVLPKDIHWHFIGHLQTNKVKYIVPFVHLIHSVDSLKLLKEINKQAEKNQRVVSCLLQIHIAEEETKFGLSSQEALDILSSEEVKSFQFIKIKGLMGMATNTNNTEQIKQEFLSLKSLFDQFKNTFHLPNVQFEILSMGMSNDYPLAIECGSNAIRIGTLIFGERPTKS
jgi:pyridoxal phosphate enzyme (YggS family)